MRRRYNQTLYRGALLGISLLVSLSTLNAQKKGRKGSVPSAKQSLSVEQLSEIKTLLGSYNTVDTEAYLSALEKKSLTPGATDTLMQYRERLDRQKRMLEHVEPVKLLATDTCTWDNVSERLAHYSPKLAEQLYLSHQFGRYRLSIKGYRAELTSTEGELLLRETLQGQTFDSPLEGAGVNKPTSHENYPFLFSDGIRLIFASDRMGGLGGYDLYQSFYNIEQKSYREPTHLSMPFNSPYNDYLFAYDEEQDYSFLLSDRTNREDGGLVLYVMFGLPQSMQSLSSIDKAEEQQTSLSQDEALAMAKLQIPQLGIEQVEQAKSETAVHCFLPLDGDRAIRSWNDFVSTEAKAGYQLYLKRLAAYRMLVEEQQKLRAERGDNARLSELEKQLPKERKVLKQELIALKNKEIQSRK